MHTSGESGLETLPRYSGLDVQILIAIALQVPKSSRLLFRGYEKIFPALCPPMSIRNRLLLTMIALTSVAVFVCSLLAYHSARQSLRNAAIRQLAGIRRSRADTVESLFERVRHDTDSLSDDRMFVDGVKQFSKPYTELNVTPDPKRHADVLRFYEEIFLPE